VIAPAELRDLRQYAYDLAGMTQRMHERAAAQLDPATEDPLEYALRVARYRTLAAAQAVHGALLEAEAELAPLGRVRR
jgi:hypothetical protein